ncbi:hypothetical protein D3C71_1854960 [compost metagenome]
MNSSTLPLPRRSATNCLASSKPVLQLSAEIVLTAYCDGTSMVNSGMPAALMRLNQGSMMLSVPRV